MYDVSPCLKVKCVNLAVFGWVVYEELWIRDVYIHFTTMKILVWILETMEINVLKKIKYIVCHFISSKELRQI